MAGSIQESFFALTNTVKIQLIEAIRFGHLAAQQGKPVDVAITEYTLTRPIFTETENAR